METSQSSAPRRRPDGGGYARGDETRARIVAAALKVFGEDGYDRASTRQIADAAGVNPPALQYYFQGKEGLHRACAEFIIDQVCQALAPALREADEAERSGNPSRMLDAVCEMLLALLDLSLTSADVAGWSRFIGRGEADGSGPAFPLIRDGLVRPLQAAFCRLVGPLIGRPTDADETRLRTIAVLSTVSAFNVKRVSTLTQLGWPDFDGVRRDAVRAALAAHTRAALSGLSPGTSPPIP